MAAPQRASKPAGSSKTTDCPAGALPLKEQYQVPMKFLAIRYLPFWNSTGKRFTLFFF
jgi:hypothetical protein